MEVSHIGAVPERGERGQNWSVCDVAFYVGQRVKLMCGPVGDCCGNCPGGLDVKTVWL